MTDHANELRRHARKIPHPQGETPGVMLRAADEIERLATKLKAAEKERDFAKTEIARLHDDIRELTDERVLDEEDRERIVAHLQGEAKAKLDSLEATEKDSAHHKALAESALRVAKGWEDKCDELRAKIEEMERQKPVAYLPLSSARILESGFIANAVVWNCRDKAASDMPLYALPGAQPAPSVPAESIGKMLAQAMDAAVANGANSVSMPDELVEVAAWLSGVQPNPANGQTRAVRDVIAERRRQIEVEGWAPEHDDRHGAHELAEAAACYCLSSAGKPFDYFETMWPWERWWFKVSDPRRDLVKAGALVLAEIERLDRAEAPKQEGE